MLFIANILPSNFDPAGAGRYPVPFTGYNQLCPPREIAQLRCLMISLFFYTGKAGQMSVNPAAHEKEKDWLHAFIKGAHKTVWCFNKKFDYKRYSLNLTIKRPRPFLKL